MVVRHSGNGHAIPTGIKTDRESLGRSAVFFSRTRCVICTTSRVFAREAWSMSGHPDRAVVAQAFPRHKRRTVFAEKHRPVGVRLMSVRYLGASRTLFDEHGAVGALMLGAYSNRRITPQTILDVIERRSSSRLGGETLVKRFLIGSPVSVASFWAKRPQFLCSGRMRCRTPCALAPQTRYRHRSLTCCRRDGRSNRAQRRHWRLRFRTP